jgi:exopolysaccharide production protein ExoQ
MSAIAQMRTFNPTGRLETHASVGARALIFLFWLMFVVREGFAVIGGWLGLSPSQATGTSAAVAAVFLLATLVVAFISRRSMPFRKVFTSIAPLKWIVLFLAWSALSLAWTHADSSAVAFGYYCLLFAIVAPVVMQVKCLAPDPLLRSATTGLVVGSFILVIIAMAADTGSGRLGDPDLLHPNTVGKITAIAALVVFHRFRLTSSASGKFVWSIAGVGLMCALAATVSKTSIAAFATACLVYFLVGKHSMRAKVATATLVSILAVATLYVLSPQLDSYSRQQHGTALETLSGRLPLWEDTWEMIQARPIIGYGFLSFRDYGPQLFNVRVVHAHNEWLHIWFSLGLVGVVLAAAIYFSYLRSAWKLLRSPRATRHAALALALLAMAMVRGITEADLAGLVFSLPLLLLMIAPAALLSSENRTIALQVAPPEWSRTQTACI